MQGGLNLKKKVIPLDIKIGIIFYFIRKYAYFSHKTTHFLSECSREIKVSAPNALKRLL